MAELSKLKKGQTITEHIDTINDNVNLINEEVEELKEAKDSGVKKVNGKTGEVTLGATDVGAFPNSTSTDILDINNIKDTGVYTGTIANKPYYLIVIKYDNTNIYQELIGGNSKKYRRFTSTWSEWVNPYSVENPIGASDITGINVFDENKEIEIALLNDGTFVKANLTLNPSTNELKLGGKALATTEYIDNAVNSIKSIIVSELPETGVENTIYFVPSGESGDNDFNEWLWVNGEWEIVGGTSIDLTPFLPKEEASKIYATKDENGAKVSKTTTINGKPLSSNISLSAEDVGALPADTKIETNAVNKFTNEEISTKLSSGEFVNGDAFVVLDDGAYKKGHIYLYNNGLVDITNYVDTATDQSIGGIKNFTGLLKYLGEEVATEKYVSENGGKIDAIKVNGVEQPIVNKEVDLEVVETEEYLPSTKVGSPLDNYYSKTEYSNLDSVKFLNEEYEKTWNLINDKSVYSGCYGNNATLTISGNELSMKTIAENYAGMWFNPELFVDFENGKTYTFSFSVKGSGITSLRVRYENNASDLTPTISSSYQTITMTFTKTTTGNFSIYAMNGSGGTLTIKDLMWVEGSTALPYQEYNGAIVHKKDIVGDLLWRNGSPANSIGATTISGLPIKEYDEFDLYYKMSKSDNSAYSKFTLKKGTGDQHYFNICVVANGTTRGRICAVYSYDNGSFVFEEGYSGTSINNELMIPVELYGRKV